MKYKWRSVAVNIVIVLLFGGILARLYMIQVSSTRSFQIVDEQVDLIAMAQTSQKKEVVIQSGRGSILDRNGKPFVGGSDWHLLVFPQSEKQWRLRADQFRKISEIINVPYWEFRQQLLHLKSPVILSGLNGEEITLSPLERKTIEALRVPGVMVVQSDQRMTLNQLAEQVIGQVARSPLLLKKWYFDKIKNKEWHSESLIGISGLEQAFEPFLHGEEEQLLIYTATRGGKPLNGVQMTRKNTVRAEEDPPRILVTTLDKEIQQKVEKILREEEVEEGAVVVQEIRSGDILAMGSMPKGTSAKRELNPWKNRAVMEATPGSIFKTVVAVAALEQGLVNEDTVFHCDGKLDHYHLSDAKPGGHGKITFAEAYAKSCNVVMGTVAKTLGPEKLETYARRFGLNQKVIWDGKVFHDSSFVQLPEEQTGLIFAKKTDKKDGGVLVQTGIGQRDVRMTPVQAANMVTSLFHQGKTPEPRLVEEIQDVQGRTVFRFPRQVIEGAKPLRSNTIRSMKKFMQKVVESGTATQARQAKWKLAGKTGTAQIGQKGDSYNKWMIGFGPVNQPRYSIAVVLNRVSDADDPRAIKIFEKVMNELAVLEKTKKEK
ncbi:peptidoglycan D,D-transpeptidase FtsI family protein [Thermoactinomyces mirandus]|uniref:Penicillin-binding protein 2 n=1 Tax=Thermoactinomyces mirandus TaxID=2756294 RepID=A0A7W1XQR5_9BACL|nr:penicillin-binding protein 2 [Thermoactinomyces mirandus]MBA4601315.1 penicillin-binding protein 2 [Thermoactinomyces mirandus]